MDLERMKLKKCLQKDFPSNIYGDIRRNLMKIAEKASL